MKIWVDADSCPRRVREIVAKAASNWGVTCEFVANRRVPVPREGSVLLTIVDSAAERADRFILDSVEHGDLVVTRDIPLAAELVEREVIVLNDRGTMYTRENVRERLSIRNVMLELRGQAAYSDPGRTFGPREIKAFAEALDKALRQHLQ